MADTATLVYDIDSSAARTAASDLAKLNDASARAAGGADKLNKTLRNAQGRFRSSYSVAKEYGSEIRSLAAKYNPALNAVYQYQQAQLELNRAVALGVLTQGQADAALERTAAQLRNYANTSSAATNHISNLSFQLNDIGMMMASGQNPFTLMIQQGPQVAQIFSQMRLQGQGIGQALTSAFGMLLNPTTALTLAVIGGSAALVQWGMSALGAESDAKSFDETLSDLESRISEIGKLNKLLNVGSIDDMREAYGATTTQVRELIAAQKFLAQELAKTELKTLIDSLANDTGTTFWQSWFGDTSGGVTVPQQIIDAENRIANLRETLKLTEGDAKSLSWAFEQAFNAGDVNEQLAALSRLREYLTIIAQSGREGADEAKKLLENVVEAEKAAGLLKQTASGLPATFAAAASAAARITDELNRAVSAAGRLAVAGLDEVKVAEINLAYRTDPVGRAGALAALQFEQDVVREIAKNGGKIAADEARYIAQKREEVIARAKNAAAINQEIEARNKADAEAARAAGGGGAAVKQAEKQYQALRELLQEDTLFQYAEYEKRSAQLANARAKDLLTEQQYQEMKKQLQMLYFGTEYEQNAINYQLSLDQLKMAREQGLLLEEQYLMRRQQLQHDYYSQAVNVNQNLTAQTLANASDTFAQLNQLAGGGYDKLLKAQKVFASGSALINAYLAASQALADPTVPYWMKIAAYAKVLAAGLGAVNAIKGGGKSGGGAASAASTATKQEPTRNVLIRLEGDDWIVGLVENLAEYMYDASKDGRVIIARDY